MRRGRAILQHGSIILAPNPDLFKQVFGAKLYSPKLLETFSISQILTALTKATQQCFKVRLVREPLSQEEWQEICLLSNSLFGV